MIDLPARKPAEEVYRYSIRIDGQDENRASIFFWGSEAGVVS